ncbi:MAG: glyoxalase [Brevundimonas sp.]|jgi:catechol 2,3-dioxygenase-like lactoylglutathione lyase family enzyme|uniref:VOC family protein n=1 Tax=Brevundimonas sp. TaxID=1871086 RepID=UPI00258CA5F2|nr:VOC family protein [Brevundimonas sp.]MCV0416242.1 glyoxalase [Brevundimonas sp.]
MTEIEDIPLAVADPEAAARFYSGLLRRRPLAASADHAVFALSPGRTLSLWRGAAIPPAQVDFALAASTAVDELHIEWWDRGARIVLPPADEDGGRSFLARDPDGNRLRVYAAA